MKSSFYGIFSILLILTCISIAAPEPSIVPDQGDWTLKSVFTHPAQIVFRSAEDNKPVRYWYMILTLTNNSGQDVDFYPRCELITDTFQILPAGQGVGTEIFDKIKQRHEKTYPFLELLGKADNEILQGQDNTIDVVLVWPDFDSKANNIDIFITGLSNETAVVEHPVKKDENNEPVKVYLRKTLKIEYSVKGDSVSANGVSVEYKNKSWVMR